ncbi:oligosaccharide flippase family protein [Mangrovibacterium marinum]|uniref:O-antigen/teichoic acid export membrane protein n=1 Tax=Mangrovibacterium marinum TaxID=1639118 RepID=A0A2T5C665_9BACT|nr:oligosaccharide flippase family protein [Mangrovibacterium marinum]PTN10427.1 O-antigen/teichoic acid export membrane protein [Mangrovibacterium marinum]
MKRTFLTNLLLLLLLNLLIKPFWVLGIDRTVQNVLGAGEYGMYFALFNFSLVLNIFLDLGITNFNNRAIARHTRLLPKYLSFLLSLKLVLALLYAALCLLVAWLVGYQARQFYLLFFLIFNQFLVSFTAYLRSNISALHYFRTDGFLSVVDRSLMIALCSALLFTNWLGGAFSVEWFVYAQTAAYLLTSLIALAFVLRYSGRFRLRFNRKIYRSFLRQSMPYALLVLLMSVYTRVDSVLLERFLPLDGDQQAGIYAQAFRLQDAAAMLGLLFAGLLLPIFSRMIKQGDDIAPLLRFSVELMMVPALLGIMLCQFYATPLMTLLYHQHLEVSARILQLLMIGFAGIATSYIFGTLLTANGSLKALNLVALAFMLFNFCLNLILIPRMKAEGAATTALATQLGIGLAQVLLASFYFKLKVNYLLLLRLAGYLLFLMVAGKISLWFANWLAGVAFLTATGLVYALLTKLISFKALWSVLKEGDA